MNIDLDGEMRPFVLTQECDVPAGAMPRPATALVRRALEVGAAVRSTYSVALVPGVLRKVKGFERVEGSEGATEGGSMERVTITLEAVVVRLAVGAWRAWASWHREVGKGWSFDRCWVREIGQAPRRVNADALYIS